MSAPGFWHDQQSAQAVVQQVKALKSWIDPFESINGRVQAASELEEMLAVEPDADAHVHALGRTQRLCRRDSRSERR
jgi:hypothetical protein